MTEYALYKIRSGQRQTWLHWCREVSTTHRTEMAQVAHAEGDAQQRCYILGAEPGNYVLFKRKPAKKPSTDPLTASNQFVLQHAQMIEACLELVAERPFVAYSIEAAPRPR